MKNKKYISQMCFGSRFQIFVLLLAMIFTLTNIPIKGKRILLEMAVLQNADL